MSTKRANDALAALYLESHDHAEGTGVSKANLVQHSAMRWAKKGRHLLSDLAAWQADEYEAESTWDSIGAVGEPYAELGKERAVQLA